MGSLSQFVRRPLAHSLEALCAIVLLMSATTAPAQRRAANRDAPRGGDRGGYGAVGDAGRSAVGNTTAKKDDDAFPMRTPPAAGAAMAEYQKPTYEHYRLFLSPDGTKLALSGSHIEKENAGTKDEKPKRDKSGKFIVTKHVVEVIDVATGRSLVAFTPPMLFDNLALSPDNRFLAAETAARPGVVNVLHLPTRKSKEFKTDLKRVLLGGLAFSSDGRSINVLGPTRLATIAIANGQTKEVKFEMTSPAACFGAAGNLVAVGVSRSRQGKPEVQIYDVATGKQTEELTVPSAPSRLQFSADGKWLAATIAGGAIAVWQTSDWTNKGRVAARLGFEPEQLAVSPDGARVAVKPRGAGRDDAKVVDINAPDAAATTIHTRDVAYLPSGTLVVSNNSGPFYMQAAGGDIAELPAEGAAALAAAQSGAERSAGGYGAVSASAQATAPVDGYAALAAQAQNQPGGYRASAAQPVNSQAGYGATSGQPANAQTDYGRPSGQPGYGATNGQPVGGQPGYGVVNRQPAAVQDGNANPAQAPQSGNTTAAPPANADRGGYGVVKSSPTDANAGYGAVQPQTAVYGADGPASTTVKQPADEPGTVESKVLKDELVKLAASSADLAAGKANSKDGDKEAAGKATGADLVQQVQKEWPRVLRVQAEEELRWRDGDFNDQSAKGRVESALGAVRGSEQSLPALHRQLISQYKDGKSTGARLELTARLLTAVVAGKAQPNPTQGAQAPAQSAAAADQEALDIFGAPFTPQPAAANPAPAGSEGR